MTAARKVTTMIHRLLRLQARADVVPTPSEVDAAARIERDEAEFADVRKLCDEVTMEIRQRRERAHTIHPSPSGGGAY